MVRISKTTPSAYARSVRNSKLLSKEEERELALSIRNSRIIYWETILSHSPITEAIVNRVRALLQPDQISQDLYSSIIVASRNYRQRDIKCNADTFRVECKSFAETIAKIDLDGVVGDDIFSNIQRLGDRDRESELSATRPPRNSSRYSEYIEKVRLARLRISRLKERFIRANLRLVISIARRYINPLIPMEDIVQEGNLGLMKAVDRFDPGFGKRFSTYATWWIRHHINRSIEDKSRIVRIPVHISADISKIRRFCSKYQSKYGMHPDQEEISRGVGLKVVRVEKLLSIYDRHISLDSFESEHDRSLLDLVQGSQNLCACVDDSESDFEKNIDTNESVHILTEAVDGLKPIEREILGARFELGDAEYMTLRELGDRHSLSRERIRQIQVIAMQKLRREIVR